MKVAVVGYGVEGQAAFRYYSEQGAEVTICDAKSDVAIPAGAIARLGADYLDDLSGFDLIVRSPGVHPKLIKTTAEVSSVTIEFFKRCPATIIGVTGTKGKGTTATLISKMLEAAGRKVWLGGNIGRPALDFLAEVKADDVVVLELSSFQLIDLKQSPPLAVVLMVVPDHLDVHADMAEYAEAKGNITRYQQAEDTVVFNAKNNISQQISNLSKGEKIPFMAPDGAWVDGDTIRYRKTAICQVGQVGLIGEHNLQNVCAAITAVWQIAPDATVMAGAIAEFKGLPHRLQFVGEASGVRYYDDSIATVPETAIAAIKAFKQPKVVILGGSDKGAHYDELATVLKAANVRQAIIIGQTGPLIIKSLEQAGVTNYAAGPADMEGIVAAAAAVAQPGDVVLLSPGCASFDMFTGYQDRGDQFAIQVKRLTA